MSRQRRNRRGKHPGPPSTMHVSDPGESVKGEVLSRKYWKTGYALGSLGTDYL